MQAEQLPARSQPFFLTLLVPAACVLGLGLAACGDPKKTESKPPEEQAEQVKPALFTVPAEQRSHLTLFQVRDASWPLDIHTTGTVDWDADHTTQAITQVNGPITRIMVDTGDVVKKDQPLLYVSSPDLANAVAAYRKARNRELFNKRIVDRTKDMLDHGVVAQKDYESAEADFNDALTDVQNSLQPLRIFGITTQEIDDAEKQGSSIRSEMPVRSPIAGVIVQKMVSPGMVIQAGQTACFMISDVSTVWVQGHIFDHDLPSVRTGDSVEESNPSFPHNFHGTLSYIGSFVDPTTRTTPVRIVTQNPGGLLKKDMFVDAVVHTGSTSSFPVVPVSAIMRDDKNEPIVYVQVEPGKFAQRAVTVSSQQKGMVALSSGLRVGETIVSEGSLFLQFAGQIQ